MTETKEQITNLPWVLDTLADRITQVAKTLKQREQAGDPLAGDPTAVKEALLTAFSDLSEDTDSLVDQLLKLLADKKLREHSSES